MEEKSSKYTIPKILFPLFFLFVGGIMGFFVRDYISEKAEKTKLKEQREDGYSLISPLLECDTSEDYIKNRELRPFKSDVEDFIKNRLNKSWARSVSVYFRELNDGLWFSVGDIDKFTPASLLKVPLMIAYYKEAEINKGILEMKLRYDGKEDHNSYQAFKPSETLKPGNEYTVDDLLYRMIVYSDNNAAMLLRRNINQNTLIKAYHDLGIDNPSVEHEENVVSVVTYSSFFRTLYNSTYLSREMSEKALSNLANTEFRTGLVAGVPSGIIVAHKFGERWYSDTNMMQLHDCGIIYHPKHPYLLCVMSRGTDAQYLDDAIAEISRIIYDHVDKQHDEH